MSSPEFNLVLNVKLFAKTFAQPKSQVPPDEILMMPKVELFYDWNCCDRSTVYTNICLKGMFRTFQCPGISWDHSRDKHFRN